MDPFAPSHGMDPFAAVSSWGCANRGCPKRATGLRVCLSSSAVSSLAGRGSARPGNGHALVPLRCVCTHPYEGRCRCRPDTLERSPVDLAWSPISCDKDVEDFALNLPSPRCKVANLDKASLHANAALTAGGCPTPMRACAAVRPASRGAAEGERAFRETEGSRRKATGGRTPHTVSTRLALLTGSVLVNKSGASPQVSGMPCCCVRARCQASTFLHSRRDEEWNLFVGCRSWIRTTQASWTARSFVWQ